MTSPNAAADPPPWNVALLQTKMAAPRPPRGRVGRHALLDRLQAGIDRTLTVVIAPAGFGKTTLLAQWCELLRAKRHVVAWLSLDAEDDDLAQFGAYLLAALSQGPEGVGRQAQALLSRDPLTPSKTIVSVLLNEVAACGRQVFIVLDDFHLLGSNETRTAVARLLRYAPENLHLLLGTRSEPSLALGPLTTQEQLLRIDAAALRFSADDAQAFFAQAGSVALDRPSVELLNASAEGWVAGLQLAALGLREAGDAPKVAQALTGSQMASHQFGIDAYLNDAVLAQLPPPMLDFLLRSAILERLGPGVCDAVLGAGTRSWEKLDWLERHNIFIRALDAERQWFRYHALLSDALRRRAARQLAHELPALHRRASQWFADQHLWPEAVRHALAAGDMAQAADWVEHCAMALVDSSDVRTVLSWLARLPPELVQARVRLRLARAWALALSLQTRQAAQEVEALASHSGPDAAPPAELSAVRALIAGLADDSPRSLVLGREAAGAPPPVPPRVRRFGETAQVFGLMYEGGFDAVRHLRAAPAEPGAQAAGGAGPVYASVYRDSMFALSALVEGQLPEALQGFEAALAQAEGIVGRDSAAAMLPAGYLAAMYYERNDLAGTERLVAERTALAMETCPLGALLRYCRAAARLHARRGDLGSALAILEEAREVAATRQWLRLRAGCDAEAVRLFLREGLIDRARQTVEALQALMPTQMPSPPGSFLETRVFAGIAQARLHMAQARAGEAAELLSELCAALAAAGMRYLEAGTALLRALALAQSGAHAAALATLGPALRYAQANGMVNSFADEGEPLRTLLLAWRSEAASEATDAAFVDHLLAAFDAGAAPARALAGGPAVHAASEQLSAREIEILNHIARGLSNKEIGRALRVAPETIKWHLKRIFEKLNVGSRVEAVQSGLGFARPLRAASPDAEGATPRHTATRAR